MQSRLRLILFTLFAPVTVPAYILFLAGTNLIGGAFYVVIEVSLARLLGRPIALSRRQMTLLSLPVLIAAPPVTAIHLLIWFVRLAGGALCACGRWQAGLRRRSGAFAAGSLWALVALWTTMTCLNAAVGLSWIGRPLEGRDAFVTHWTRYRTLGQMPDAMQQRRRDMISQLAARKEAVHPNWKLLITVLEDDEYPFHWLQLPTARKLANLPWFFIPAEISEDGADHSLLLLGPLLFVWMLMVRWPGSFVVLRPAGLRVAWFALRAGGAVCAVYALVTWAPLTDYLSFPFEGPVHVPAIFGVLSPAWWIGLSPLRFVRPEWWLFNAALWMVLLGAAAGVWWLAWRVSPFLGSPRYYVAFLAARLLQRKRIAFFSVGAVTLCVAMMIIVISVMGGFLDTIRTRAHGLLGDLVVDGTAQGFPYYQGFIDRISAWRDDETGRPVVVQATPLIHSYGLLQITDTKMTKAVRIWGIRLDEYVRVNQFGRDLFYQNRFGGTALGPRGQPVYGFDEKGVAALPDDMERHYADYLQRLSPQERAAKTKEYRRDPGDFFIGPGVFKLASGAEPQAGEEGKPYHGVIIGRDIIARRMPSGRYDRSEKIPRGSHCYLTVLPLTRGGDISPEQPPKVSFRYVDDSRTGIHEIDSMNVYVDFDELQRLLDMGPQQRADGSGMTSARCSQIQIKLDASFSEDRQRLLQQKRRILEAWDRLCEEVPADAFEYQMMRNVDVQTWEEMQQSYISAIEKEKFLVLIMFGVISVVAVFLILCIFYMIVQEKTRDIGIIKSVGGSAEGVAAVFLAYGGAIGIVGCILGSLLGITFVENINEVQDWLARLNPNWRVWSPETYSFDKIPDVWKWSEVLWISVLAVIASIAGAAFPAVRAGRTWPVESLRYE